MKNAHHNDRETIESLEPLILMSASTAELQGTDCDDILIAENPCQSANGAGGNDVVVGAGGDNELYGGDGDDILIATSGFNLLDGGDGTDTAKFVEGPRSDFSVVDLGNGILQISDGTRVDNVTNVELFEFADGTVTLSELLTAADGAPVVTTGQHLSTPENQAFVVNIEATDAQGDTLAYSLADALDASLFTIDSQTGALSFINAPDFENPQDDNGDNIYDVIVKVSDGKTTTLKPFWISVTDVNENGGGGNQSPFFTNVEQNEIVTVPENTTLVGDADGVDPDGDPVTFSISDGIGVPGSGNNEDAGLFNIDPQTGVLSFKVAPDFEHPADGDGDNDYHVTLVISDGKGGAQERKVVVKVTDVTEGGGNNAPFFTNVEEGEIVNVAENTTLVGDADGVDPNGDAVTFSIVGGADASKFVVNAQTGVVSFQTAPDFENPGDADGNNLYQLRLRISDGTLFQDRNVTIRVTNVNEGGGGNNAPFFTNVEEGEIVNVAENTTLVGDADGVDPNGDAVTFSIVGGADSGKFVVNAQTGVVSFVAAPDFETPGDADGNNLYQLRLRISDGTLFQDRNVTIRVTNVNEGGGGNNAPFFTNVEEGEIVNVAENTTLVGDADGVDPNGDAVTFSIVGGADSSKFVVNAQTGVVSFQTAPDFENPGDADGNNLYQLRLRISDGTLFQDRNVTIRVTNVNEGGGGGNAAPFFTNVAQNQVVNVFTGNTLVGDANAQDPNGDPVTFAIVGGADAGLFTVDAQTGVVLFKNAPNVNSPGDADGDNNYQIRLRVSDGSLFQDRDVTVRVFGGTQPMNRAPFFTNVEQGEIVWMDENTQFVGDANAFDFDGDALAFSIVGGVDRARFTINPTTGQLFFLTPPDFENPTDANGNNLYELVIRVSDGHLFQDRLIGVNVEDVNEGGGNHGGGNKHHFPWLYPSYY